MGFKFRAMQKRQVGGGGKRKADLLIRNWKVFMNRAICSILLLSYALTLRTQRCAELMSCKLLTQGCEKIIVDFFTALFLCAV